MEPYRASASPSQTEAGRSIWADSDGPARLMERHPVGGAYRGALERAAMQAPTVQDVPPLVSALGGGRHFPEDSAQACQGLEGARGLRPGRRLRGRVLIGREKGGPCVGKTKRGKGTKVMEAVDGESLPLAAGVASASPREVKLLEATLDESLLDELPELRIGDKAYDSDRLDERLWDKRSVKLVAPHPAGRKRKKTQDGRELRRYKRRWKVERFFAWLHFFRHLVIRYERKAEDFLGFLPLACALILLRQFRDQPRHIFCITRILSAT